MALNLDELPLQSFGNYDVPHLGALCRQIRTARGITGTEIARWCGCSTGTITRDFEQNNELGDEYFARYLSFFESDEHTQMPLSQQQASILQTLYAERGLVTLRERHSDLSCISFEDIHPSNHYRPTALKTLVDKLAMQSQPALIMDDLWFIHCMNKALLDLYEIKVSDPILFSWELWHTIAGKIPTESPVRKAHSETGEFIPATIVYFFQHESIQRHLFTLQVRQLLTRLLGLSQQHDYKLHIWWRQLISFALPYALAPDAATLPYSVIFNNTSILTRPKIETVEVVTDHTGHSANYTLVVWEVQASENPAIRDVHTPQPLFFAKDYDVNNNFHVNTWEEVNPSLEQWV